MLLLLCHSASICRKYIPHSVSQENVGNVGNVGYTNTKFLDRLNARGGDCRNSLISVAFACDLSFYMKHSQLVSQGLS